MTHFVYDAAAKIASVAMDGQTRETGRETSSQNWIKSVDKGILCLDKAFVRLT